MAEIKDDVPTLIEITRTGKGDIIRAQAAVYLHDNALKSEAVSNTTCSEMRAELITSEVHGFGLNSSTAPSLLARFAMFPSCAGGV